MDEPLFLRVEDVERLHAMSLERFGGSDGLRDRNAFESAVHQPKNVFFYGGGDLFDMAAAYCFHIAQRRPSSMATSERRQLPRSFSLMPTANPSPTTRCACMRRSLLSPIKSWIAMDWQSFCVN